MIIQKFRPRPVTIEAVQFLPNNKMFLQEWANMQSKIIEVTEDGYHFNPKRKWFIPTLEGDMIVSENDWVIRGLAGEFYPCKPEIFEKKYEVVQ